MNKSSSKKLAEAKEIIESFIKEESDYMIKNFLGNPEFQHNIRWGRKWLKDLNE